MENISVSGLVATTPRHLITADGLPITSFRLASSSRRFDRTANKWVESDTNWYTVSAFRTTAVNVAGSISKGDRITLTGRLRVRDWDNGERYGTSVEIEVDAIGHDLTWGTTEFTRTTFFDSNEGPEPTPTPTPEPEPIPAPVETHSCNCQNCER